MLGRSLSWFELLNFPTNRPADWLETIGQLQERSHGAHFSLPLTFHFDTVIPPSGCRVRIVVSVLAATVVAGC